MANLSTGRKLSMTAHHSPRINFGKGLSNFHLF